MSEGERRGRRRRRKRRGADRFAWATRTSLVRAAGAGVLIVLAGWGVTAWLSGRDSGGLPTGRAYHEARLALGAGDLSKALSNARAAVDDDPDSREARLLLAIVLHRTGDAEGARAAIEEDVRRDVDYDAGREVLAAIAMAEEDYAAALVLLREAIEREPTPVGAWRLLARIRMLTGDTDGAINALRQAVDGAPDDLGAWLALGDVQLAVALDTASAAARERAGHAYREAERIARRTLRETSESSAVGDTQPRLALAKALAGQARALRGMTLEPAEAELVALVQEAGDDIEPTLVYAGFLRAAGRESDARALLESAEQRWQDPAPRLALARVLESLGERAEALAALRRAVTSAPRDEASRVALVHMLMRSGRLDEAAEAVDSALASMDDSRAVLEVAGDLAVARASAATESGDVEGARELRVRALAAYERALERSPRSMPLMKKRFGEILSVGLERPDELEESDRRAARAYVESVLELNPSDADALAWRGRLLLLEGEPERALDALSDVAAGDAPPLEVLRLYGLACERTGRAARAADTYTRVLARMTRRGGARRDDRLAPPDVWADAARGALRIDRPAMAVATLAEAVSAWPGSLGLRVLLAESTLRAGGDQDAIAVLDLAAEELGAAPALASMRARVLESSGDLEGAERVLRAAVADHAGHEFQFELARILARRGRREEARAALDRAVAEAPVAAEAALREGDALLRWTPPEVAAARSAYARAADQAGPEPGAAALVGTARFRLAELALLEAGRDAALVDAAESAIAECAAAGVDVHDVAYLRGKLALLRGRFETAVTELERSLESRTPSAAALYYLARARSAAGDARAGSVLLEDAIARAPEDSRIATELGLLRAELAAAALADGAAAEALESLEQAAGGARSTFLVALARAARLEWRVAEQEARAFLEMRPDDPAGRHLLAAVLVRSGDDARLEEAARIYEGLRDEGVEDSDGGAAHACVALAEIRARLGQHAEAVEAWTVAARELPTDRAILRGLARALVACGRATEALARVDEALNTGARDGAMLGLRADVLLHLGRLDEAAEAYRAAMAVDPEDIRPLLGAAVAMAVNGEVEGARVLLQENVARCDDPSLGWRAIGDLLVRAGDLEGAREVLARVTADGLPSGYDLLLRGGLAEALGGTDLARTIYSATTESEDLRVARLARLAMLLDAAGEPRRAIDTYGAILRIAPRNVAAINNRALLLARDDDQLADAVEEARRARDLDAAEPHVADTLGWLLVRSGVPGDGLPLLREAAQGLPDDARVAYHLGVCLARLGEVDDARTQLERALELDTDFPESAAARAQLERLR